MGPDKARRRKAKKTEEASASGAQAQAVETREPLSAWQVMVKALTPQGRWTKDTFPEFYDAVFCGRQLLGLVVGVTWGCIPVTGMVGVVSFVLLTTAGVGSFIGNYCGVNDDDFGEGELLKEGMNQSIGIFLLSWILTYTVVHQDGALV